MCNRGLFFGGMMPHYCLVEYKVNADKNDNLDTKAQ